MSIRLVATFRCDQCGQTATWERRESVPRLGQETFAKVRYKLPDGWRVVRDLLICPQHLVRVDEDKVP